MDALFPFFNIHILLSVALSLEQSDIKLDCWKINNQYLHSSQYCILTVY